uniref:J domain-containing protein n=1 Tax=Parastrongyloides trichosuri TaxID=131310 RepID=A0A0N4ZCK8_PARTI
MSETLYDILNCDKSSTKEQILAEYKQLAKKYHPDKCVPDLAEHFKKIQYAKDILTDDNKRHFYDVYFELGFSMPIEQWMENFDKYKQTLHWRAEKPQPSLMSSVKDDTSQLPKQQINSTNNTIWSKRECNPTINAFRNYQI